MNNWRGVWSRVDADTRERFLVFFVEEKYLLENVKILVVLNLSQASFFFGRHQSTQPLITCLSCLALFSSPSSPSLFYLNSFHVRYRGKWQFINHTQFKQKAYRFVMDE